MLLFHPFGLPPESKRGGKLVLQKYGKGTPSKYGVVGGSYLDVQTEARNFCIEPVQNRTGSGRNPRANPGSWILFCPFGATTPLKSPKSLPCLGPNMRKKCEKKTYTCERFGRSNSAPIA